jgi:hypothetical protein
MAEGSAVASVFSDRTRQDASPLSGESMYTFLDRVAGPFWDRVRRLIEDWVNAYCPDDQTEMVARLHTKSDIDFTAAYWELLLYQGLKALGFEVTCHPEVAGTTKRPDFLVEGDKCSFYLEAKVLGEDSADRKRDQARNDIYHELNARVHSDDFFVRVHFDKESARPIPIQRLADTTQAWLDGLNPVEIRKQTRAAGPFGATPLVWEDEPSGWSVAIVPVLKSSGGGGGRIVGLMGGDASWIDDRTPVRKALDKKAHRYGNELDRPFVVALGVLRAFADDTDVMEALFGNEVYLFDPTTGAGKLVRRRDGLWIGPDGPRTTRLSAVLVGLNVAPWLSAQTVLKLWKNPSATFPLDCDAGGVATIIEPKDDGSLAATAAIVSTGELLGLPPDWPGPEPAFARN